MKVYVLNMRGLPLMPTTPRKARILVKSGKASIIKRSPFTIKLNYAGGETKQHVTLGIDPGYKFIGFSAITDKQELISGQIELLQGISQRLQEKSMYRTQRRSKLRYRKPRFKNRCKKTIKCKACGCNTPISNRKTGGRSTLCLPCSKSGHHAYKGLDKFDGKLPPSIQHKLDTHIKIVNIVKSVIPVDKIVFEVADFDIQKINNPDIQGKEYQQGEQLGYRNVKHYVKCRDGYECQICGAPDNYKDKNGKKKKIKDVRFETHHIIYRSCGGTDIPSNLLLVCSKCHTQAKHNNKNGPLWKMKEEALRGKKHKHKQFKAETFMSTIKNRIIKSFKCKITYGYLTQARRNEANLRKTHYNDAFCIAGGNKSIEKTDALLMKQWQKNKRSLERFYDAQYIDIRTNEKTPGKKLSCGRKKRNKNHELNSKNLKVYRGKKISKGRWSIRKTRYPFQHNDLVLFDGQICRCGGTSSKGKGVYVVINGEKVIKSARKTTIIKHEKSIFVDSIEISTTKAITTKAINFVKKDKPFIIKKQLSLDFLANI